MIDSLKQFIYRLLMLASCVAVTGCPSTQSPVILAMSVAADEALRVDCAVVRAAKPTVFLILGQSNAANHGELNPVKTNHAYTIWNGQCYQLSDRMPGATGAGSSPWALFANQWLAKHPGQSVLIINRAVTSTTISQWLSHETLQMNLQNVLQESKTLALPIQIILWHQGEADAQANTSGVQYGLSQSQLIAKLQAQFQGVAIYVAQTTVCRNKPNEAIRAAQASSWQMNSNVLQGPDTDQLGASFRHDGCHFSASGLQQVAEAWLKAISPK